jgi:hypothetical protein|tara:strand:+ start:995 stop:1261 length:267 start_codon:yes stop_codon:yes gene_type:complete
MDFMEDIELYNLAMDNAYALIVGDVELDEMIIELDNEDEDEDILPLPFNPFSGDKISNSMIDIVINHYTGLEEYEKCARLVKAKEINA